LRLDHMIPVYGEELCKTYMRNKRTLLSNRFAGSLIGGVSESYSTLLGSRYLLLLAIAFLFAFRHPVFRQRTHRTVEAPRKSRSRQLRSTELLV
jgi:hypothetical protein